MQITPKPGYIVDPNNPNGVVREGSVPTTPTPSPSLVNPNADYFNKNNQAPTTPTPTPTQTPTPSQYYPRMTTEPTPVVAETAEQIQERKIKNAQGLMDNLNKFYDTQVEEQTKVNIGRERGTNAISTLTGLAGSTEAEVAIDKTKTANQKEINAINQQRAVAISGILTKINDSAVEEARLSREEARQSAQDMLAYREKAQTEAVNYLTALSKSSPGLTMEGLKATLTPEEYGYMVKNIGGEAMINSLIVLNRPQDTILDKRIENGRYVIARQNPITGKINIESTDLGVPPEYTKSIDLGDKIMLVPDNFNPEKDKPIYISKGIPPKSTTPTLTDKKTKIISDYTNAFAPGVTLKNGTSTVDSDGYATPYAWKEAIKEAPTQNITRTDFIKNFGHLLPVKDGKIPDEYGLTTIEKRLILGVQSDNEGGA